MKRLISVMVLSLGLATSVFATGQINIATVPFVINTPGSYIVVKDLRCLANQTAISITTSDVNIDLNGHILYGAGTSVGIAGSGIYTGGIGNNNIRITNGTIRDFRQEGLDIDADNAIVDHLVVFGNGSMGINIQTSGLISNCIVQKNNGYGINISNGSVVKDNLVMNNFNTGINCNGDGNIVNNTSSSNQGGGIYAGYGSNVTGNTVNNNNGIGISAGGAVTVVGNNLYGNSSTGIYISGDGTQIRQNTLSSSIGTGILINSIGCSIIGNMINSSHINGIDTQTDAQVKDNTVVGSYGHGIAVTGYCQIVGNHLAGNSYTITSTFAIYVNNNNTTIENNSILGNNGGLRLNASGNYFSGNRFRGNVLDISTVAGNTGGNGTHGFTNIIVPASQPNFLIQQFAGFNLRPLQESKQAVLRNLIW